MGIQIKEQNQEKQEKKSYPYDLIVRSLFDNYKLGDVITDTEKVSEIIESYKSNMVIKVEKGRIRNDS